MFDQNNNHSNMEITKLYLFETGASEVNDVYQRGYSLTGGRGTVRKMENLFEKYGVRQGYKLTESLVAKEIGEIIQVSPHSNGQIYIPNGWNHKRLNFVLEVKTQVNPSKVEIYFLQGFTDYYDPVNNMSSRMRIVDVIDPQMAFHINSMAIVDVIKDSKGNFHTNVKEKVSVIKDLSGETKFEVIESDKKLSRPSDIVEDLFFHQTTNGNFHSDSDLTDAPASTNKDNLGTTGYFTEMMNQIIKSENSDVDGRRETTKDYGDMTMLRNASLGLTNYNLMKCPFFLTLYQLTHEARPSYFTVDILLQMDSFLDEKTDFFSVEDVTKDELLRNRVLQGEFDRNILESNNLADTQQPTVENLKSYELMNLANSALLNNMLTKASIYLSNDPSKVTQPIATVINAGSIFHQEFASPRALNRLSDYFETVILPKLTGDDIYIDAIIDINVLGKTSISMSINMDEAMIYRYDSSADGLYSPHINSKAGRSAMVNDVSTLIDLMKNDY